MVSPSALLQQQEQAEQDILQVMQTNSSQTVAELSVFHRIILGTFIW